MASLIAILFIRFQQAWKALRGTLEPEVATVEVLVQVYVPIGEGIRTVYRATSKRIDHQEKWVEYTRRMGSYIARLDIEVPAWHGKLFETCADAFRAGGDEANVQSLNAFISGGKAYVLGELKQQEIECARKPRVAKGKRK